jgi:hypothetical protein
MMPSPKDWDPARSAPAPSPWHRNHILAASWQSLAWPKRASHHHQRTTGSHDFDCLPHQMHRVVCFRSNLVQHEARNGKWQMANDKMSDERFFDNLFALTTAPNGGFSKQCM